MPDQLTIWQQTREQVPWRDVIPNLQTPVRSVQDGFVAYAASGEGPRRLSLLLTAYGDVRCAASPQPLIAAGSVHRPMNGNGRRDDNRIWSSPASRRIEAIRPTPRSAAASSTAASPRPTNPAVGDSRLPVS